MTSKKSWYRRIADTILEMETIDLDDDTGGYPTIHWLIANHMLSGYSDFDRHRLLDHYVGMIKGNFEPAIRYLFAVGKKVYKDIPDGRKPIKVITLDPEYEMAALKDRARVIRRVRSTVRAGAEHLAAIGYPVTGLIEAVNHTLPEKLEEESEEE